MVTSGTTVRRRRIAASVAGLVLLAACGSGVDDGPDVLASPVVAPSSTVPGSSEAAMAESKPAVEAPSVGHEPTIEVVAALGYPRDLLDRGRVNLKMSRDDDADLVVLDKRLVADFFDPAPVETRRSVIPAAGQQVALQTLFGEVGNCDDPAGVTAAVEFTYLYGDDDTTRVGSFPLADATTLDGIRAQACTARQVLGDHSFEFAARDVEGETLRVDLEIARLSGGAQLSIDAVEGTVLFGAETPFERGTPERRLDADADRLVLPIVFDVNRCDAHAIAETTKKFGLNLYVSVDGAEMQRVPMAIDEILPDLELMHDRCKERTAQ